MSSYLSPILVTGAHRSGTTWTGKMIALSPDVVYIQEPFNKDYFEPGICRSYFEKPFFYITKDNEHHYYDNLHRTVTLNYNWNNAVKAMHRPREIIPISQRGVSFLYHRLKKHQPLLKDPFALLSTPWLVERFNMMPVILIRHPAAFAGSIKRFSWESEASIRSLLQQPLLMRDYLNPMHNEIERFLSTERTIVEQAALFWKILYTIVDTYRQKYPNWLFIRHEDLSRFPHDRFHQIFDYLSLPYTNKIQKIINQYTNETNPNDSSDHTAAVKLNSQANIWNWQNRLTLTEIESIQFITGDIAGLFYTDDEWSH